MVLAIEIAVALIAAPWVIGFALMIPCGLIGFGLRGLDKLAARGRR